MKRLRLTAIAVVLLVLVAGAAFGTMSVTVTLRNVAEVKGDTVLVGDVAHVRASTPEVATLIAGMPVAPAPEVGTSAKLGAADVRAGLAKLPLDMNCITLDGAPTVVVSRSGQVIRPEHFTDAVRRHVIRHTRLSDDDVVCEFVRIPRTFAVPCGEVTSLVVPVSNKPYAGYHAFSVRVRVNGVEAATERVAVTIRLFRPVVVAERRLVRDEVITDEDLRLERREVTVSVGNYFTDTADLVGKRATRTIAAGTVLTDVMLARPLAVRRNDYVTLVARHGAVRVRTKCIVLKDACVGDSVDVMNKDSKKIIRARVVAPNLVELIL